MDIGQVLALTGGSLYLVTTAVGLAKSLYEIRKLKTEIENLHKPKTGEPIYRPNLDEILKFQGDVGKYAEWLERVEREREEAERERKSVMRSEIPGVDWGSIIFFNYAKLVHLQLPASCKLPQSVLGKLEGPKQKLEGGGSNMFAVITLLFFAGFFLARSAPPIEWLLALQLGFFGSGPGWGKALFFSVILGFLSTQLYIGLIKIRLDI
jgi:hypothetical protein